MSKHVDRENEDLCAYHIRSLYPVIIPIISASHSDSLPCSLFATAFILVLLSLQNSMDPYTIGFALRRMFLDQVRDLGFDLLRKCRIDVDQPGQFGVFLHD